MSALPYELMKLLLLVLCHERQTFAFADCPSFELSTCLFPK